jgi:hypothetical protein
VAESVSLCRLADRVVWDHQVLVRSDAIRSRFEPAAKAHMGLLEEAPPSCRRMREPRVLPCQHRRCRIQLIGSSLNAGIALEQA